MMAKSGVPAGSGIYVRLYPERQAFVMLGGCEELGLLALDHPLLTEYPELLARARKEEAGTVPADRSSTNPEDTIC